MKIACIVNTHEKLADIRTSVTLDTIDSVRHYMTDDILLLVDGACWSSYIDKQLEVATLKGFCHNHYKGPYRNVIFGLLAASKKWPDADWWCYLEYDCLVGSSSFIADLECAAKNNIWCLGNDYRSNQKERFLLVELMLKEQFNEIFYILGSCVFLNQHFIKKAMELNFFERFLSHTNDFAKDFFPGYCGWDLTEHLLPTLAKHWGGDVQQMAQWSKNLGMWVDGNFKKYPIRWQPDIALEESADGAIIHPSKTYLSALRMHHREKRKHSRNLIKS